MKTIVALRTCVLLIISVGLLPESKAQTNGNQDANAAQAEGVPPPLNTTNNFFDIFDDQRVQETAALLFSGNINGFINAVAESPAVSQIRESFAAAEDTISGIAGQVFQSFFTNDTSVSRRSIREAASKLRVFKNPNGEN